MSNNEKHQNTTQEILQIIPEKRSNEQQKTVAEGNCQQLVTESCRENNTIVDQDTNDNLSKILKQIYTLSIESNDKHNTQENKTYDEEGWKKISNEEKGDNIHTKNLTDLRIFGQNINSLRPGNMEKWKGTIDRITHLQCDLVGISETAVNWSNNKLKETYKNCLKKE
jgi:hypothetical protein